MERHEVWLHNRQTGFNSVRETQFDFLVSESDIDYETQMTIYCQAKFQGICMSQLV